ncbi:TetR/AcrR family transcriptional regulator [Amycolatopsis nigrescens]|uniref:TetR/AcrR family transcriptional regulator n=1 Tax=Amycolatopsis nigrescens TaxID=381445 RepID=UPI0003820488|nr:TetR/AcrR family transcriptional regulator [Amycolatopsis nigrescens]
MSTRTRILEAAAALLADSPIADVSTRAVCEAAGVGAPALYRQFGDKEGLLSAVVDYGFEQYLSVKRAAKPSADPVRDLRAGWDSHIAFAVDHPSYYRLMYSPAVRTPPETAAEAHRLLVATLERCAAAGRLRVSPETAAQMIMAANVGMALMLVSRTDTYDPEVSSRLRDAVHAQVLTPASKGEKPAVGKTDRRSLAAALCTMLREPAPETFSAAEVTLFREWLTRLSDAPAHD